MFWILLIISFCILCFALGWNTLGIIILSFFIIFGIVLIAFSNNEKKRKEEEKHKQEEKRAQEQAEMEKKIPIYNSRKNELIEKYGQPDKTIILEDFNINKEIIAFGRVNRIWILGKDLPMCDIISCTFSDNSRVEKGRITHETKTSTGNMAARAFVGGILRGDTGAVIGGATANK